MKKQLVFFLIDGIYIKAALMMMGYACGGEGEKGRCPLILIYCMYNSKYPDFSQREFGNCLGGRS